MNIEQKLNNGGIYIVKCTFNNKVYVGSCYDFNKRKHEHFKKLENNTHNRFINKDYKIYSKYFVFEEVEKINMSEFESIDDYDIFLSNRELYYIMDVYKSHIPTYGIDSGYNWKTPTRMNKNGRRNLSKSLEGTMSGDKHPSNTINIKIAINIKQLLLEETNEKWIDKYKRIANKLKTSPRIVERIKLGVHWTSPKIGGSYKDWIKDKYEIK
jgi:group I intron endonuclease